IRDELGDLLVQVVFQARIAEEAGNFAFADIAQSITAKMIRRHPHIFGDAAERSADEQRQAWEDMKARERAAKKQTGVLDDVATTLPPMTRAVKLQKRAARLLFDWTDPKPVMDKVLEELDEVNAELTADTINPEHLQGEIGDLLFAGINLARKSNIDPDEALAQTNRKFTRRFQYLEATAAAQQTTLDDTDLDTMEQWWQSAKHDDNSSSP
ncbi:MAG: nucleoside triphosphate pyrophosphohydrolase, partial [Alphaproteobacteria bacterium]|nr:nucleoside triphosphate pyrophosphohydrolase [Alphaproteobacteria bacterium]